MFSYIITFIIYIKEQFYCMSNSISSFTLIGEQRHDQKEFVWTLHKSRDDWESKIKWPTNNDNNNNI